MTRKFDRSLIPPCPTLSFEASLWESGCSRVGGIDEAGRGALAGPVAAACVILPQDMSIQSELQGARDSKEMTAAQRDRLAIIIKRIAISWGVGYTSPEEIDGVGIIPATILAIKRALLDLNSPPDYLLVDALTLPDVHLPQESLIKGDARSLSIACASILAKTSRDAVLKNLNEHYSGYGLNHNKGYGTPGHLAALAALGPSPIHRITFAPIRQMKLYLSI